MPRFFPFLIPQTKKSNRKISLSLILFPIHQDAFNDNFFFWKRSLITAHWPILLRSHLEQVSNLSKKHLLLLHWHTMVCQVCDKCMCSWLCGQIYQATEKTETNHTSMYMSLKRVQINWAPTHCLRFQLTSFVRDAHTRHTQCCTHSFVHTLRHGRLFWIWLLFFQISWEVEEEEEEEGEKKHTAQIYGEKKIVHFNEIGLIFSDWYEWIERVPYLVHEAQPIHVHSICVIVAQALHFHRFCWNRCCVFLFCIFECVIS